MEKILHLNTAKNCNLLSLLLSLFVVLVIVIVVVVVLNYCKPPSAYDIIIILILIILYFFKSTMEGKITFQSSHWQSLSHLVFSLIYNEMSFGMSVWQGIVQFNNAIYNVIRLCMSDIGLFCFLDVEYNQSYVWHFNEKCTVLQNGEKNLIATCAYVHYISSPWCVN